MQRKAPQKFKNPTWFFPMTVIFAILSLIIISGNFYDFKFGGVRTKVNLGLDLKGGSHLMITTDFDTYMKDVTVSNAAALKRALRSDKIGFKNFQIAKNTLNFELRNKNDAKKTQNAIKAMDNNISCSNNDGKFTVYYNEYAINQIKDRVIDQSMEIVRMRVDTHGTKDPIIQRQGDLNIILQVPGEENPAELKSLLGKTAKLTFHLHDEKGSIEYEKTGKVRRGSRLVYFENDKEYMILKKQIVTGGDDLFKANMVFQEGNPVVSISFNNTGARKFSTATQENKGKRLAIVMDNKIISAPSISNPIYSGDAVITGNFSVQSANELALMLKSGALPAPLKVIEERTIGPNLGSDSIQSGKIAAIFGFALVVIFMVMAYGKLGIIANISVLATLFYLFALLSATFATLTLPGIAGIILTIGMSVDANVLIYERIREEINNGSSKLQAVRTGFNTATVTVMDSNLTTLIAAFLLYNYGVGAIKGFAVTLTMGVISSMWSALVVTRLIVFAWIKHFDPKKII